VPVTHVDFTEPFSPRLRTTLFDAARACGESLVDGAVYACTQGPRLESAAEVERLARDGADLVGMTGMPEAALARELDFEYATIAVVVNHAAGRGDSVKGIKFEKLEEMLQQSMGRVRKIIEEMAQRA
jgi:5'-methylthioinosine phosphorylase